MPVVLIAASVRRFDVENYEIPSALFDAVGCPQMVLEEIVHISGRVDNISLSSHYGQEFFIYLGTRPSLVIVFPYFVFQLLHVACL